jgi:hypothetical protein
MRRAFIRGSGFIIAVAISVVSVISPAIAADYDRNWIQGTQAPALSGSEAVSIYEYGGFENISHIPVVANAISSGIFDTWECPDGHVAKDAKCDLTNPKYQANANTLLPYCLSETQENCIVGLTFKDAQGVETKATYLRTPEGPVMDAIPSQKLYQGTSVSLFQVTGSSNGLGTDTYAVNVFVTQTFNRTTKVFETRTVDASVYGYRELKDASITSYKYDTVTWDGGSHTGWHSSAPSQCMWREDGACGEFASLPTGITISLDLRISNQLTGWFRGRMKAPNISIEPISDRNNRLVVSAEPVEVARFYALATKENTTPAEQKAILEHGGNAGKFNGNGVVYPFSNWGEFSWLEMFRDLANDTAVGTTTLWNFSTINGDANNKCLADKTKVLGIVSTNATLYNGIIPAYETGYLKYDVAGLHYLPDGQLTLGTYDLVMDSSVARCLYGFTKAPVSATVTVVGAQGEEKIATSIVSEKDGWLKLAAYGFTFSEKQVRVKLTQPYSKTITKFSGTTKALTSKQKAEIKVTVNKAKGNPKFICTGVYVNAKDKVTALKRARAACDYAKSLDKNHSYWAQAKQSKAKSYDGKVMLISK